MADNHVCTEFLFPNDARLVGAVGGAVEHAAEQAGLPGDVQREFAAAAEDACREALPFACTCDRRIKCTVHNFPDRIEVVLEHAPSKPGPAIAEKARSRVDHVKKERHEGIARVTLVKYIQ